MKKKILMIISLFVLLISSTACSAYDTPTEISGYFKYKINSDNNKIMIVGLTNTGKKQETLVIPSEINRKQVYRIGEPFYTFSGSNEWICNIESKKLMNLYYPSTITQTMLDDDYLYEDTPNISKI